MSSRSLAAARARRAGENAPPVSGNRPGTSIGSYAHQMPQGYQPQMPPQQTNVRVVRGQPQQQPPRPPTQQMRQQMAYQQVQQSQEQAHNSLPFSKLSISDAIGLITLRLGRVEQWVIETEHETASKMEDTNEHTHLPENAKIIDNSVFSSIMNRLEDVEKREKERSTVNNGTQNSNPEHEQKITKLTEDVNKFTEQIARLCDEGIKHNLAISKHTEQLFKFERELVETKDILKTFMIRYDMFANDTTNKFADYELALSELEKSLTTEMGTNNIGILSLSGEMNTLEGEGTSEGTSINDIDTNAIASVDLKSLIKQELASSM